MRSHFLPILAILASAPVYASTLHNYGNNPFAPVVKSYFPGNYNGGRQNWSATQSEKGIYYIGNNNALLEYDGHLWRSYTMPGGGIVRSVYSDGDGRIYCGSFSEFGYFDLNGEGLAYTSLSSNIEGIRKDLSEIWNIVRDENNGNLLFQSFNEIYVYDGNTTYKTKTKRPLNLIKTGGGIYSQLIDGDFIRLYASPDGKGYSYSTILSNEDINGNIVAAFKVKDRMLILSDKEGACMLDNTGVHPFHSELSAILKRDIANRAVMTADSLIVIGTIKSGIYCMDLAGNCRWKVNCDNFLLNNTVLGLYRDNDNNIIATLDDGVAFIGNSSGIYSWQPEKRIGMIYGFCPDSRYADIATNHGIYRCHDGRLFPIAGLTEQVWCIEKIAGREVIGYNNGIYILDGEKARLVSDKGKGTICIKQDWFGASHWVIAGNYKFPAIYRISDSGEWEYNPLLENIPVMARQIESDEYGNIWCSRFNGGLFRITTDPQRSKIISTRLYRDIGNVRDSIIDMMRIGGRIVFSNGKEFYFHDNLQDSIVAFDIMNKGLSHSIKSARRATHVKDDLYWILSIDALSMVRCGHEVFEVLKSIPFSHFGIPVEERATIRYDRESGDSYLCLNNRIVRINTRLFISKTADSGSELEMLEFATDDKTGKISYILRYPTYDETDCRFKVQLNGKNGIITDDNALEKQIGGLKPGKYELKAEVVSAGKITASLCYPFRIKQPWYFSKGFILIWSAAAILSGYGLWKYTRQAELRKRRALIARIRQEYLEKNLHEKSKDLSGVAINLAAYQELMSQIERIVKSWKDSGEVRKTDIDGLDRLINGYSSESEVQPWSIFMKNFDVTHDDFFKKLKAGYPSLTGYDLKLCALLRADMSTKEIARMLNLSIRGVESARYRLRKKLALSPEDGLIEFLQDFGTTSAS